VVFGVKQFYSFYLQFSPGLNGPLEKRGARGAPGEHLPLRLSEAAQGPLGLVLFLPANAGAINAFFPHFPVY